MTLFGHWTACEVGIRERVRERVRRLQRSDLGQRRPLMTDLGRGKPNV
jgi:hypothetical protein